MYRNNRNVSEKQSDSDDDEWFLGFDEKGKDVYMKDCLIFYRTYCQK